MNREMRNTECLIDGKRIHYDACSQSPLEEAREYYKEAFPYYLGSSKIYFIDGVKNKDRKIHHFFSKTNKQ